MKITQTKKRKRSLGEPADQAINEENTEKEKEEKFVSEPRDMTWDKNANTSVDIHKKDKSTQKSQQQQQQKPREERCMNVELGL